VIRSLIITLFVFGTASLLSAKTPGLAVDSLGISNKDSLCDVQFRKYDYYNALQCYLELVDHYEDSEAEDRYYASKNRLAHIYHTLGYTREAAGIAAQVAEHFKGKDPIQEASAKLLLSEAYFTLGENEKSKSIHNGISRRKVRGLPNDLKARHLLQQARLESYSGDSSLALSHLDQATKWCLKSDAVDMYAKIQYYLGDFLLGQNKSREALKAYLKSSKVAKEVNNYYLYVSSLEPIVKILADNQRFEQAYELTKEREAIRDSLFDLKKQEIISRMIVKYESQKKQKTIYDLEGEQRVTALKTRRSSLANYALMISFIAVLAAAYLIITFYQQKLSSSQIITEQKEMINQQKIIELQNNLKIESMQSMLKGQELERERVAQDLHDSLGGMLSAIKLKFEALNFKPEAHIEQRDYNGLQGLLDDACQEVRNISSNLQPGALEQLGLLEAISDLVNKYEQGSNVEIHFQHYGVMDNKRLDSFTSLNIYRIIQELLNNSLKHSKASEILVQLNREADLMTITVEDDGVGYDTRMVKEGMGSENIRSRVNFLKADLHIDSVPGEGTTTIITVPIDQ
jgi:signal transduction histidine kinase